MNRFESPSELTDQSTITGGELPMVKLGTPAKVEDHVEYTDGDETTNLPDEHQPA